MACKPFSVDFIVCLFFILFLFYFVFFPLLRALSLSPVFGVPTNSSPDYEVQPKREYILGKNILARLQSNHDHLLLLSFSLSFFIVSQLRISLC